MIFDPVVLLLLLCSSNKTTGSKITKCVPTSCSKTDQKHSSKQQAQCPTQKTAIQHQPSQEDNGKE